MGRSRQQSDEEKAQEQAQTTAQAPLDTREIQQIAMMPPHEYKGIMQAKVAAEADKITTSETVEGGRFKVDDRWVNANGEPLDDQGDDDAKRAEAEVRR